MPKRDVAKFVLEDFTDEELKLLENKVFPKVLEEIKAYISHK